MTTQKTYRFTITTPNGQPLFTVLITRDRPEVAKPALAAATPPIQVSPPPSGPAPSSNGEPKMTEPQKRYLFRLLAQQGVDGKAAEAHLKQTFRVITLREVSKMAASQLIEQLVADQKEVGHGQP